MNHQSTAHTLYPPYSLGELCAFNPNELEHLDALRLYKTPPGVLSSFVKRLDLEHKRTVLRKLSERELFSVLSEMEAEDSAEILGAMRERSALKILDELEPSDAAGVLAALEEEDRVRLLSKLSFDKANLLEQLLKYDKDTAGSVMNPNVATVQQSMNADAAIVHIRKLKNEFKRLFYIYVVDQSNKLIGVLSMRDLILAAPTESISNIMRRDLKGVCTVDQDKSSVALQMGDCNFYALPVIDHEGHLVGIIEHHNVIDILQKEATEDIQRLVGAGPNESIHDKVLSSVCKRNPWLIVNLFTASWAGAVVYIFRHQIEQLSILAVFVPILASIGGNTGAQTLSVFIRSLALGELEHCSYSSICWKEGLKGCLNGIIVGGVGAVVAFLFAHQLRLSFLIFTSAILNMCLAGALGAVVPVMLQKLDFDPAQSASIFLTAVTDCVSSLIILGLGTWLLL